MSNGATSDKDARRIVASQEGFQTPKQDENNNNIDPPVSSSFSQDKAGSTQPGNPRVYAYTICNGLSNQLLHHAAHLSKAKQLGFQHVAIPNHFILQGTQTSDADVGVTSQNSIPFGHAFDAQHFLHVLQTQLQLQGHFDDQTTTTLFMDNPTSAVPAASLTKTTSPRCLGLSQAFEGSDPLQVRILLQSAFRPSREHMEPIVETILGRLSSASSSSTDNDPYSHGVCLHDRNGQDWIDHCQRWSAIPDGIYRGNCLPYLPRTKEESSSSIEFLDNLKARVFPDPPPDEAALAAATGQPPGPQRWVYYCGDHADIPSTLVQASASYQESNGEDQKTQTSTLTSGAAYWYNSQSIPLSQFWKTYEIPVVYTYTEESMASGKHFLQASIASVRHHMPHTPIHILYHGQADIEFRNWLQQAPNHVILHTHNPTWAADIEDMRLHGDVKRSHLFSHAGNYLGTWQRIDIPLFVDAEYALLLDSDAIVQKPLSLHDFGLDMTHGLAMSSELQYPEETPSNAGIMLMNIPFLRQTHSAFIKYIVQHKNSGGQFGNHPSPSDQGAYLTFYADHIRFLEYKFNMKPYFPLQSPIPQEDHPSPPPPKLDDMKIVHFHGPKPHQYIAYIALGKKCPKASHFLCIRSWTRAPSSLCHALSIFAQASLSVTHPTMTTTAPSMGAPSSKIGYCQASFHANPLHAQTCQTILEALVTASRRNQSDDGYGIPDVCTSPKKGDFARFIIATLVEEQRPPVETMTTTTTLHNRTAPSFGGGESSVVYDHHLPCSNIPQHLLPYSGSPQQQPLPDRHCFTFFWVFVVLTLSALLWSTVSSWLGPPSQLQRRRSSNSSSKNGHSNNDNSNNATGLKRLATSSSRLHEEDESQQQAFGGNLKQFQLFMILGLALCWDYWQTLQLSSYVVSNNNKNYNNNYIGPPLEQQQQQQQPQFYQSLQYPQPVSTES